MGPADDAARAAAVSRWRRGAGAHSFPLVAAEARPRVVLRSLTARDRDDFVTAMKASRRLHRPWISPPANASDFAMLLARSRGETFESMLLRRWEDDAIVGYFNLGQIVRGPLQSGFLGYGAVAGYSGKGYMTEGMTLVLRRAFTELRLHRVEANIQPENLASIALVRRCGFVSEGFSERYLKVGGRWRDHERWAIRSEQWRERRGLP
jgi:ribosomal-protein-alanine N-acetyltransferase